MTFCMPTRAVDFLVGAGEGLAAVYVCQSEAVWSASWNIIIHSKLEFWIARMVGEGGFGRF